MLVSSDAWDGIARLRRCRTFRLMKDCDKVGVPSECLKETGGKYRVMLQEELDLDARQLGRNSRFTPLPRRSAWSERFTK